MFGKSIVVQIIAGREEMFALGATVGTCHGTPRVTAGGGGGSWNKKIC